MPEGEGVNSKYLFSFSKKTDLKGFSRIKPRNPGGTKKPRTGSPASEA